jgi:chaperone modulatory protein CbpM
VTESLRYPLLVVQRSHRLGVESFAARGGVHPELVRRLVALGVLEAVRGRDGELWLAADQLPVLARALRLQAGLPLNYAALGLVMDLLDRIQRLETTQRTRPVPRSEPPWT